MTKCPRCGSTLILREDDGELVCFVCSRALPIEMQAPHPLPLAEVLRGAGLGTGRVVA